MVLSAFFFWLLNALAQLKTYGYEADFGAYAAKANFVRKIAVEFNSNIGLCPTSGQRRNLTSNAIFGWDLPVTAFLRGYGAGRPFVAPFSHIARNV
jgi:hypothetical protein